MKNIHRNFRTFFVLIVLLISTSVKAEIKEGNLGENVYYEWDTRKEEVRMCCPKNYTDSDNCHTHWTPSVFRLFFTHINRDP